MSKLHNKGDLINFSFFRFISDRVVVIDISIDFIDDISKLSFVYNVIFDDYSSSLLTCPSRSLVPGGKHKAGVVPMK